MFVNPEDNGEGEGEEGEDEEEEDEEEEDEEEADEAEDEAEESKNGAGHEEEYGGNEDSSDEEEEEGVDIAETTALAPPDTSREGPPNYGSDDDSDDNDSTDEDYDSAPDYEGSFSDRWTKALFEMFPKIFPHLSHLEGLELEGAYEDAMMSDLSLYGGIHGIRSLVDLIDNSLLKSFTVTRLAIPFLLLLRLPTCLERLMLANATWDRYREFELDGMVAVTDSLEKIAPKHLQLEVSPEFSNLLSQQPRSLFENLSTLQVNILCEDMLNNVHEHILPNAISTLEVLKLDYSELDDTSAERYSQRLESLLKSMKSAPRLRTLQFQLCSDHIHKPSPSCPSDPSRLVKAYLDSPLFHGIKRLELDVVWGYGDRSVTDCFVDRSKSELDVLDATLANEAAFPNLREVKVNFRARGRWNTATPNDRGARERAKEEQRTYRTRGQGSLLRDAGTGSGNYIL
ncbi:hypothetical protein BKA70DRAFT_1283240, partial [Coprinopsis sp. MPI-PUGE-AT-0042]